MASNRTKKTKIKPGEKIDRLSSLPDPIIHHILSFLPSTLTAIETCVLPKRWRDQWTRVPVLIFDYRIPRTHFSTFVDSVLILHDSPTITKFVIRTSNLVGCWLHSLLPVWIRFAMRKQVKKLTLDFGYDDKLELPRFFFDNGSLVKFKAVGLIFSSCEQVNWPSLKVLSIESCIEVDKAIGNIVRGSPLLESLQFSCDDWNVPIVITSTLLKRLVIVDSDEIDEGAALEIACPNLEELKFSYTFLFESYKLVDLPSSARVTLNLRDNNFCDPADDLEADENKVQQILQSVKHVDVLNIGRYCLQVFSVWVVVKSLSSPRMNTKFLTLNVSNFDWGLPGIVSILRNSPVLEKLVINFDFGTRFSEMVLESYDFGERYWNSTENMLNGLGSHLKTIELFGLLQQSWKDQRKLIFRFLKFLVKNAQSLEEIAIYRKEMTVSKVCYCKSGEEFSLEHFKYLLGLQKCCPGVNFSVSCCKAYANASLKGASQVRGSSLASDLLY